MKHKFQVVDELDTTVAIAVGAYLDCEHYLFLHKSITGDLDIVKIEGRKITVRQTWKWYGLTLGHYKSGEYFPPARFIINDVKPAPWWVPSVHHFLSITTDLKYEEIPERKSTRMVFDVELDMPFWMFPLRGYLQRLVEKMHAAQNDEDMACIKRRARLFGRENNSAYLAQGQFLYHKDDYVACFGPNSEMLK